MFKLIKRFISLVLIIVIVLGALFYYAYSIEPFHYKTTYLDVQSSYLNLDDRTLSVVFFADTHFGSYYSVGDFKEVVEKINALKPDFVFFGGDLIDNYDTYDGNTSEISSVLAEINASIGKYCVFGNHDYGGGAEFHYADIMETGGFSVIKNGYIAYDSYNLSIVGIDELLIGYGTASIASYCRPDFFNLVICHEPDLVDDLLVYNVDLMMSGHTHGRQINIDRLDDYILPPYGKKYIKGKFTFDNERRTELYVNSGIGMTKLPLRFGSPPEITQVVLSEE